MTGLPRLSLFEANDAEWAPDFVREAIVETLTETLTRAGILDGLAPIFADFVARAGVTEVLDLCAGAGAPACLLGDALRGRSARPPKIVMTDLYPRVDAWRAACASRPGVLDYVTEPVDATRIPEELARGRARMIVNAFHHLPPALAQSVLDDAVAARSPILIAECFDRDPRGVLPFAVQGVPALLRNPVFARRRRLARAVCTWAVPVIPIFGLWDALASTFRIYTRADLERMTAGASGDFDWQYDTWSFCHGGRGHAFTGVPRAGSPPGRGAPP